MEARLLNRPKKVCIVGLDGLSLENLVFLLKRINLPHIRSIIKNCSASPQSLPPLTPAIWTSIFTGVNPGKHGIFGFKKAVRYKDFITGMKLVSPADIKYPRIFEMLGMLNLRSVVINVPLTYPFNEIVARNNMIIVTDWIAPNQKIWPYSIEKKYREYLLPPPHKWGKELSTEKYVKKVRNYLYTRMQIYLDILESHDWDLFIIVFSEIDWILHKVPSIVLGEKLNLIKPILELIDKFLASVIKNCEMTVLVSDHGFNIKTVLLNLNSLFIRKGFLRYEHTIDIKGIIKRRTGSSTCSKSSVTNPEKTLLSQLLKTLRRLISTSQTLNNIYNSMLAMGLNKLTKSFLDYNNSIALMIEPMSWGVYVKKDYEEKVREVFNGLKGIKKVFRINEIFNGPYINNGPCLLYTSPSPRD